VIGIPFFIERLLDEYEERKDQDVVQTEVGLVLDLARTI